MTDFRKCWPWIAATTARRTLLFVFTIPAVCQSENPQPLMPVWEQSSPHSTQQRRQEQDEELPSIQKENVRKANERRQLELKRDTDKLLQLTSELKQYVDQTNENILSLEVIRKAEEIERLAKSVKEKMKGRN